VHQSLVVLASSIGNNWRWQHHLAGALPAMTSLFSQDVLVDYWAPYALGLLLNGRWAGR
jgi:hypothetical protein